MNDIAFPSAGNRLLAALSPEEAKAVAAQASLVTFGRGEVIHDPGDVIDRVLFPGAGIACLVVVMENGATAEAATIGREGLVGFVSALGSERPMTRIVAQTDLRAVALPRGRFEHLFDTRPAFRQLILCYTEALLSQVLQSVACNALHTVDARCARWLLMMHDRADGDDLEVTHELLAEMLGVQRSTVTAVARALQDAGLIRYRRGSVMITDRAGLEAVSCECYGVVRSNFERLLPRTYLRPRLAPPSARG